MRAAYHAPSSFSHDQQHQQSHPPAPPDNKEPPPPSRVAVAAGRLARMRWVTVAGVVVVGLGGIMVADWAAETLVNSYQASKGRGGEDDF
jgi:hypothetical protein